MTTFPRAPKLLKGAIVAIDPLNPLASVIIFQYNPKQLSRQVQARTGGQEGAQAEALRLASASWISMPQISLKRAIPSPSPWAFTLSCRPWRCCFTPKAPR